MEVEFSQAKKFSREIKISEIFNGTVECDRSKIVKQHNSCTGLICYLIIQVNLVVSVQNKLDKLIFYSREHAKLKAPEYCRST